MYLSPMIPADSLSRCGWKIVECAGEVYGKGGKAPLPFSSRFTRGDVQQTGDKEIETGG